MTLEQDHDIAMNNFYRVSCNPTVPIEIIRIYKEAYCQVSDNLYKPKIEAIKRRYIENGNIVKRTI